MPGIPIHPIWPQSPASYVVAGSQSRRRCARGKQAGCRLWRSHFRLSVPRRPSAHPPGVPLTLRGLRRLSANYYSPT